MAEPGALLLVPIHAFCCESISTKASTSLPGSSGAQRASSPRTSRPTLPSWSTFPQVNDRRNDPSVDGARTPPNSMPIAPCRSRPRPSMLSAPPIIPATIPGTFTCAFTPHRWPVRTCSSVSAARPARWASAITGTRPARDTRFGSSNVAWIFVRSCNNRTCEVPSRFGIWKRQQLPSSQFRGHLSRRRARTNHYLRSGLRLSSGRCAGSSACGIVPGIPLGSSRPRLFRPVSRHAGTGGRA